jgi:thiamine-phosphate diphosphorylase
MQELSTAMAISLQGYYAILDVKGSSYDATALLHHASDLLSAQPCCLQLRGKQLALAALCELGHALRPLCSQRQVPLCVNDRLDVALAIAADIVHLGQGDLPLAEALHARKTARAEHLSIGISTHDLDQAKSAAAGGADYIGFGPLFPTQSKADADPAVGLARLQEVAVAVKIPVVAIGGITLDNVADVARTGASAAAAIAAVDTAPDPARAGLSIAHAFGYIFTASTNLR